MIITSRRLACAICSLIPVAGWADLTAGLLAHYPLNGNELA